MSRESLFEAVTGELQEVTRLLDAGADPAATDDDGFTALTKAIVAGKEDVVRLLVARGAPVDTPPRTHTAVRAATLFGRASILKFLLEAGADASIPSHHDRTALMGACFARAGIPPEDCEKCVRLLLDDPRGNSTLLATNSDGDTALHLACTRASNATIVECLLKAGADLDSPTNNDGKTPRDIARENNVPVS